MVKMRLKMPLFMRYRIFLLNNLNFYGQGCGERFILV